MQTAAAVRRDLTDGGVSDPPSLLLAWAEFAQHKSRRDYEESGGAYSPRIPRLAADLAMHSSGREIPAVRDSMTPWNFGPGFQGSMPKGLRKRTCYCARSRPRSRGVADGTA